MTRKTTTPGVPPANGSTPHGNVVRWGEIGVKRERFRARAAFMRSAGTFTYYPGEDRFEEVVSVQAAKWSPTGKPRIMPQGLSIYGREVFDAPENEWRMFLEGHPLAIAKYSSEFNPPSEPGGYLDRDAFAIIGHDRIGGGAGN